MGWIRVGRDGLGWGKTEIHWVGGGLRWDGLGED